MEAIKQIAALSAEEKSVVTTVLSELAASGKSETLDKLYAVDYDQKPATIDEFIEDPYYLGKIGIDLYPVWRKELRYIFDPRREVDEVIIRGCLVGSTEVHLLDGSVNTLENLAVVGGQFYVYSYDTVKQKVVVGIGRNPRCTGRAVPCLRVNLDNGRSEIVTPDHLFLMLDGTYRSAIELSPGDSLMPLYLSDDHGYTRFWDPIANRWVLTHRMVAEYKFGNAYLQDGIVAHHRDLCKRNNHPDNIDILETNAHLRLHASYNSERNKRVWAAMTKEARSELMRPRAAYGNFCMWHGEDSERYRKAAAARMAERNSNPEYQAKCHQNRWTAEAIEQARQQRIRYNQEEHPSLRSDITFDKVYDAFVEHPDYSEQDMVDYLGCSRQRIRDVVKRSGFELAEFRYMTQGHWPQRRPLGSRCITFDMIWNEFVTNPGSTATAVATRLGCCMETLRVVAKESGFKLSELRRCVSSGNHKVVSVEPADCCDVYNIEVDTYENFALTSGVFVHNSVGSGKTSVGVICILYAIHRLICLKNPQRFYRLMDGSPIVFGLFNIFKYLAQSTSYTYLVNWVKASPFFQDTMQAAHEEHKRATPEWLRKLNRVYGLERSLSNAYIHFPKDIVIALGSQAIHVLGENLVSGILDEVDLGKSKSMSDSDRSQIADLYGQARTRIDSRFMQKGGGTVAPLILISQVREQGSFLEQHIQKTQSNPRTHVISYSIWEAKAHLHPPEELRFRVCIGNQRVRSFIVDSQPIPPECQVIEVPESLRKRFEYSVDDAIRDLAGISTYGHSLFIPRRDKIFECYAKSTKREHPFTLDTIELSIDTNDTLQISDCFVKERCMAQRDKSTGAWTPRWYPGSSRAVHIDLAINKDCAGMSMGTVGEVRSVERFDRDGRLYQDRDYTIFADFAIRFKARRGSEIDFSKIRAFVFYLQAIGFPIKYISLDGFQCLSPATLIQTNHGIVPLSEVRPGYIVHTYSSGPQKVNKVFEYGNVPTVCINTQDGCYLEGTFNHKLLVYRGGDRIDTCHGNPEAYYTRYGKAPIGHHTDKITGKIDKIPGRGKGDLIWVSMSDIAIGDRIVMNDSICPIDYVEPYELVGDPVKLGRCCGGRHGLLDNWDPPKVVTKELAEWLGLIWGDGYIRLDTVLLTVNDWEVDEFEDALAIFRRLFLVEPTVQECYDRRITPIVNISVNARWLFRWMELNGLKKPLVPEAILRSGKDIRAAFLRGLFAADGHVKPKDGQVSLSTKHYLLAIQVRDILRMDWGISSRITTAIKSAVKGGEKKFVGYIVGIRGNRRCFYDNIGFSYSRKRDELAKHIDIDGYKVLPYVESVTYSESSVIDLEVEGDHTYVANGFISHNSRDSIQQFLKAGYLAKLISVDKNAVPYNYLKSTIMETRLDLYEHAIFTEEMTLLQDRSMIKGAKPKIDHPPGKSKDIADAVCGVVTRLTEEKMLLLPALREKDVDKLASASKQQTPKDLSVIEEWTIPSSVSVKKDYMRSLFDDEDD